MCFWLVKDSDIQSLRARPSLLKGFLEQLTPAGSGVTHRNVEFAHYILNGTKQPVDGVGRLFQTWFDAGCKDLIIKHADPAFAFSNSEVRELMVKLSALTDDTIAERATQLDAILGRNAGDDDYSYWTEAFAELRSICKTAIADNKGLLWTPG